MRLTKKRIIELLLILLLGLVPLLWFKGSSIVLGHDAGLTLSPITHFLDRLSVWTERFAFGSDQSYALPGFFIHGLEALVGALGFGLQSVQKIVFIFWFVLPGVTMYCFLSRFEKDDRGGFLALPASVFYMFNHFLLQGWFVAERTKFSLYAALPLIMALLFSWQEGKKTSLKTALLVSLTLFVLNGGGSLPLFGGMIIAVVSFVIFYFIEEGFSKKRFFLIAKLFFLILFFSGLLNAYWLFPYGYFVLNFYSEAVSKAGGVSGVLGWISYVSSGTSLANLLRLQGIPEWYQNPLHPYANFFLKNPILLFTAAVIPVLAFAPLLLVKQRELRKKVLFFSFLALFSMIFVAGSQPPFGIFYTFLIKFVPGFVAFRTPFYKFASSLWFSYAILIAFSLDYFSKRLEARKKNFAAFFKIFVCLIIIFYSFPFLNGMFFDYIRGVRSMRVQIPSYVYEFGKWSDSWARINKRTLALPKPAGNVEAYAWGYWSLAPLTTLLTNASIINESGYMPPEQTELVEILYEMMRKNQKGWQNMARILGIESFLLRKDFAWNLKGSVTDDPLSYKEALESQELVLVNSFGEWEVYDFKDTSYSKEKIQAYPTLSYLFGKRKDLGLFVNLPIFDPSEPIYIEDSILRSREDLVDIADKIYFRPECESCNLIPTHINTDLYTPLLTRGSIFYPAVVFFNRLDEKSSLVSLEKKLRFYLSDSLRKLMSLRKVIDEKRGDDIILLSITDYSVFLGKLSSALDEYLKLGNIDNEMLIQAHDFLRLGRILIVGISSSLNKDDHLDPLFKSYTLVQEIRAKIDKNIWKTTEEDKKRLLIIAPKSQEYNMLYRPNDPFLKLSSKVAFSLDGTKLEAEPKAFGDWFYLGKLFLEKGKHFLEIEQGITNLYAGSSVLEIFSSKEGACYFSNDLKGVKKDDIYRISFSHRRTGGDDNFVVKVVGVDQFINPFDKKGDVLHSSPYWRDYVTDYPISFDGEPFRVVICNYPDASESNNISSIEVKNINLRKLDVPDVVFYSEVYQNKIPVSASFIKQDKTTYEVKFDLEDKQKVLLTLGETFYPGWRLEGAKEDKKRFLSNGFANGWVIEAKDEKAIIRYFPEILMKIGFIVAGVSLLGFVAAFLLIKEKDENKN